MRNTLRLVVKWCRRWIVLLPGLGVLAGSGSVLAVPNPAGEAIDRVAEIRRNLLALDELYSPETPEKLMGRLAQWLNWPNYWVNWPNWNNWNNWLNWGNWRNF